MKKIVLVGIVMIFFTVSLANSVPPIRLYTLYTPSHEVLLTDWFLPSLKDDYELVIEKCEQICPSGSYMSEGWIDFMHKKVDLIIRAVRENWGWVFLFSDVDIQFFAPTQQVLLELISHNDMVIQKEHPRGDVCTGFFMCRCNERVLKTWLKVKEMMFDSGVIHEQMALNELLHKKNNPFELCWKHLPEQFFGAGTCTGKHWKPGDALPIPDGIVMHHANWTRGIENKIAQLEYVKREVSERGGKNMKEWA